MIEWQTRFIAKHGLKSNINRLTLSEGEIAIAYSDDKSEAEIYVGGNDNTPIPAAGASMKTKNQIFVVCDGDHDELKIQAALSRATRGTVVYIMGDCVLTNENTQDSGLVSGFGHYNAILNVGIRVTLDGTYCSSITFKNTNPAARQVIFFLGIMAKLKNINFQEDNTTCTQTSVNPMILFGNSNAIVDNCVLGEVYDVNQDDSTVGNIIMCSGSKFTNNVN